MIWIVAAIATATPASGGPTPVVAQATATVRIVSGVRIRLDSPVNAGAPEAHETRVTVNGAPQRVRLIEFQ